jgi:hypothetical protein
MIMQIAPRETIKIGGNVAVDVWDVQTEELLYREIVQNHIPLVGRTLIGAVMIGDTALTGDPPSHIAIGTATSAPADTDTQLGNEVYRNVITQKSVAAGVVTWKFFVPSIAANGYTLSEACIFNSSGLVPVPPMLSRVTHTPFLKTANISVTYTWVHTFTQST